MIRTLGELVAGCPEGVERVGAEGLPIRGITADSRQVGAGWLFAALPGSRADGRGFVGDAVERGAVAVLHDGSSPLAEGHEGLAQLIHPHPRRALAWLAAAWHGHPARRLRLVGITGTNGKTTVAAMVEGILGVAGERVGVVGTTGIRYAGEHHPNPLTTPDPVALQGWLARMAAAGCGTVVMEVSSHALDQERVAGLGFAAAVFTNLSRDHLDYHPTEGAYFAAKARLFRDHPVGHGVFNADDPRGLELAAECRGRMGVTTFGVGGGEADVTARDPVSSWGGAEFRLHTPVGGWPVRLPLAGGYNVANALAAAGVALALGVPGGTVGAGLAALTPVPGRLEAIRCGQPFAVVVDFAHTPDALERLLGVARGLTRGRVVVVFGCGGDRDPGKRPLMGEVAGRGADLSVITDDNPRSEDPAAIRRGVIRGCEAAGGEWREVGERREAIRWALARAAAGDAVVIAGKGHERVQITAAGSHPFDDVAEARAALGELGWASTG